jgi:hypothetical protein
MAAALLAACLWPLNPFPHNDVTWLPGEPGVKLGKQALLVSAADLSVPTGEQISGCTLTITLRPMLGYVNNSATFLVVYTPANPLQFRLMQYRDELLIRRSYHDKNGQLRNSEIELAHVFNANERVSFAVTSGPQGTGAYRNGLPAGESKRMGYSCRDLSGQLVIGNSPLADNAWQGEILSLAIYNRELTAQEILQDYTAMNSGGAAGSTQNREGIFAQYSFTEGTGKIIHNHGGSGPELRIPNFFRILHKKILTPPWKEFTANRLYVLDVAVNVAGFVPFGFLLCFYLGWDGPRKRAILLTIVAGAAMSTTIEILQIFIPSRTSGMTDIITNTVGSGLGAVLWNCAPVQSAVNKLRHLTVHERV